MLQVCSALGLVMSDTTFQSSVSLFASFILLLLKLTLSFLIAEFMVYGTNNIRIVHHVGERSQDNHAAIFVMPNIK